MVVAARGLRARSRRLLDPDGDVNRHKCRRDCHPITLVERIVRVAGGDILLFRQNTPPVWQTRLAAHLVWMAPEANAARGVNI